MQIVNSKSTHNFNNKNNSLNNKKQFSFKAVHIHPDLERFDAMKLNEIAKAIPELKELDKKMNGKCEIIIQPICSYSSNIRVLIINVIGKFSKKQVGLDNDNSEIALHCFHILPSNLIKINSTNIMNTTKSLVNNLFENPKEFVRQINLAENTKYAQDMLNSLPYIDKKFKKLFDPDKNQEIINDAPKRYSKRVDDAIKKIDEEIQEEKADAKSRIYLFNIFNVQ